MTGRTSTQLLASLCGGYLHEDFTPEYGSAVAAVQAWLADASAHDAVALSAEWRSFLNVTYGMSAAERARALRAMAGGAWAPANSEEFDAVSALLIAAGRV
ncbi:MAG: hypothetical protein IT182_02960 [Acidobacteria bacterium]|nr:hypothetical protein [Acidobacteriota bacterium]